MFRDDLVCPASRISRWSSPPSPPLLKDFRDFGFSFLAANLICTRSQAHECCEFGGSVRSKTWLLFAAAFCIPRHDCLEVSEIFFLPFFLYLYEEIIAFNAICKSKSLTHLSRFAHLKFVWSSSNVRCFFGWLSSQNVHLAVENVSVESIKMAIYHNAFTACFAVNKCYLDSWNGINYPGTISQRCKVGVYDVNSST